jgi:TFIIF-interacting CTD phosphatase-like protein
MTQQQNKINVILDIDETLLSAIPTEDIDFEKIKNKAKKIKYEPMEGYYILFLRPHLEKFLDFLFENFNVSIWTAASKDYALYVIDKIILNGNPKRKIDYIFFSYHCNASKKLKKNTKDLSMLWDIYKIKGYNKDNTIIIDDYDEVYNIQKDNCIFVVPPFNFLSDNSENDRFLKDLIQKLKKHILKNNNITNINKINEI